MKPRTAMLVGWAKILLTLLGLAVVLRLGLPARRLAIAAAILGGAGFWSGLIVFRGAYERDVEHRRAEPKRAFRRAALLLFLTVFWLTGVVSGVFAKHWAEAFATFVLWWVGVLIASAVETRRQLRLERRLEVRNAPRH